MIVRISNRFCLCQIASSTIKGDDILVQAQSKELAKYGLPGSFGLKNWTACYATGLLLARRTLKKLGGELNPANRAQTFPPVSHIQRANTAMVQASMRSTRAKRRLTDRTSSPRTPMARSVPSRCGRNRKKRARTPRPSPAAMFHSTQSPNPARTASPTAAHFHDEARATARTSRRARKSNGGGPSGSLTALSLMAFRDCGGT